MIIRFYTCLVCHSGKIAIGNDDKTRMFIDVCHSCQYRVTEFKRLSDIGLIKENKI